MERDQQARGIDYSFIQKVSAVALVSSIAALAPEATGPAGFPTPAAAMAQKAPETLVGAADGTSHYVGQLSVGAVTYSLHKPHPGHKPHTLPGHHTAGNAHVTYSYPRRVWLKRLRMCESGGNYKDTAGLFEGAYQFLNSTWQTLRTGYAHAYDAPPRVQDKAIIKNTQRSPNGIISQNPGCYQKGGLSPFPPK